MLQKEIFCRSSVILPATNRPWGWGWGRGQRKEEERQTHGADSQSCRNRGRLEKHTLCSMMLSTVHEEYFKVMRRKSCFGDSGRNVLRARSLSALCFKGCGMLSVLSGLLKWASQPHCHAYIYYAFSKLSIIQEVNQYFLRKPL